MGLEDLGLDLKFRSSADTSGSEQAASGLHGVSKAAHETDSTLHELGYTAENIKKAFIEFLAFAEVIAIFKEGTTEAYNLEKAWRGIDSTARTLGLSTKETREHVERFAKALGDLAGTEESEVIRAISDQVLKTNNLEEAISRVSLAHDIAKEKGGRLADGMALVDAATLGITKSFKKFIGEVVGGTGELDTAEKMIAYLENKYRGFTKTVDDSATSVDRSRKVWMDFKEWVGGGLLKAFAGMSDAFRTMPALASAMGKEIAADFKYMGVSVLNFVKFLGEILPDGWAKANEKRNARQAQADKELKDAEIAGQKEYLARTQKNSDDAKKVLDEAASHRIHAAKGLKDGLLEQEKDYQAEALQSAVTAAQTAVAREIAERELLAHQEEKELEDQKGKVAKTEADKEAIRTKYRNLRFASEMKALNAMLAMEDAETKRLIENTNREAEAQKKSDQALLENRLKIEALKLAGATSARGQYLAGMAKAEQVEQAELKRLLDANVRLETAKTKAHELGEAERLKVTLAYSRAQYELARRVFDAVVEMSSALFGDSKELALAKVTIDTALAIMAIWADSSMETYTKIAYTVIAAAEGIAQYAKIAKTDYSSKATAPGFDSPSNDYAAYVGGGAWARHMVQRFQSGATAGFSDGLMGLAGGRGVVNSTTDNRRIFNVNMYGASFLDPSNMQQVKQFHRALTVMDRQVEQARVVGKTTR